MIRLSCLSICAHLIAMQTAKMLPYNSTLSQHPHSSVALPF